MKKNLTPCLLEKKKSVNPKNIQGKLNTKKKKLIPRF